MTYENEFYCGKDASQAKPKKKEDKFQKRASWLNLARPTDQNTDELQTFDFKKSRDQRKIRSRKFMAWGDKTIIDGLSQFSKVKGGPIAMPEVGVHGRGGSYLDEGLWLVDQYSSGSCPLLLFAAYENVAILQTKSFKFDE